MFLILNSLGNPATPQLAATALSTRVYSHNLHQTAKRICRETGSRQSSSSNRSEIHCYDLAKGYNCALLPSRSKLWAQLGTRMIKLLRIQNRRALIMYNLLRLQKSGPVDGHLCLVSCLLPLEVEFRIERDGLSLCGRIIVDQNSGLIIF